MKIFSRVKSVSHTRRIAVLCLLVLATLVTACGGAAPEETEPATEAGSTQTVSTGLVEEMPEFTSFDLDGNTVDNSIFANADITVVNFWGTYCGPCINEMPDLAAWSEDLPDNVQIIGVVIDVPSTDAAEFDTANELVSQTGVEYTNIIVGDQFDTIMGKLVGVPTTFFVDSEGKCLHEEVLGADVDQYKRIVEKLQ